MSEAADIQSCDLGTAYKQCAIGEASPHEVVVFITRILEDECGMRVRRQLESSVWRYFERFDSEDRLFSAFYREGEMRALLGVDRLNDETGVLKWIFVAPEDRNRGLGERLMDCAIAFAKQVGYQRLILCTATQMKAAHRLYRKKGFTFKQDVTFWRRPMKILERLIQVD